MSRPTYTLHYLAYTKLILGFSKTVSLSDYKDSNRKLTAFEWNLN